MATQFEIEEISRILERSLILENDKLLNIILAIGSSENKKATDEEIKQITGLSSDDVVKSIDLLDESNYIITTMQEIPGRSLHKVRQLTDKGESILKLFAKN